jgi:hypothetical protein
MIDKEKDATVISHPERYGGDTTYECIKVLEAWLPEEQYKGFLRGNTLKYLCRLGKKDQSIQELKKAAWYLNKLIEKEEKNLEK